MVTEEHYRSEVLQQPVKKLFVPPSLSLMIADGGGIGTSLSHKEMLHVLSIFQTAGYSLVVGDSDMKEGSIGIFADPSVTDVTSLNERLSHQSGVPMPKSASMNDASPRFPLVAKYPKQHAGRGIYLIEDFDQLAKLKAKMILQYSTVISRFLPSELSGLDAARRVLEQVRNGSLDPLVARNLEVLSENFPLQEYIETPGSNFVSFRIVADCHGVVHYGAMLRSQSPKSQEIIDRDFMDLRRKETMYAALLENHESPLFLQSKSIVSNQARGGVLTMLNGDAVHEQADVDALSAHGIDPDNPRIPNDMYEAASVIGSSAKALYPFVGVDFVLDSNADNKLMLLEVNLSPIIYPSEFGVIDSRLTEYSQRALRVGCEFEMMHRVANYKPAS